MPAINGDWLEALKDEFKKDYYKKLFDTVDLFLGLVWSYLCFNIVMVVVMFIYLKIYIINQLIDMNHN